MVHIFRHRNAGIKEKTGNKKNINPPFPALDRLLTSNAAKNKKVQYSS
jgi:hypothetical protein